MWEEEGNHLPSLPKKKISPFLDPKVYNGKPSQNCEKPISVTGITDSVTGITAKKRVCNGSNGISSQCAHITAHFHFFGKK